jgi:hypothetical protein
MIRMGLAPLVALAAVATLLTLSCALVGKRSYEISADAADSGAVVSIDSVRLGVLRGPRGEGGSHLEVDGPRYGEMTIAARDGRTIKAAIPTRVFEYVYVGRDAFSGRDTITFSR